jgi:hypothetical protein
MTCFLLLGTRVSGLAKAKDNSFAYLDVDLLAACDGALQICNRAALHWPPTGNLKYFVLTVRAVVAVLDRQAAVAVGWQRLPVARA